MAIFTLKNENVKVNFSDEGAEIKSIQDNYGNEYISQGDNSGFWSGQAPILFPIVGKFPNDFYTYQGKIFPINIHGFAQQSHFEIEDLSDTCIRFVLKSNENTLAIYPFDFKFAVTYTLMSSSVEACYTTTNLSSKLMYFSLGAHNGYMLRDNLEQYQIEFEKNEFADSYNLISNDETLNIHKLMDNSRILKLNSNYFSKGAVTFKNLRSKWVILKSIGLKSKIKIEFGDFEYLTLWTQVGALYLCIEPWSCESANYCISTDIDKQKDNFKLYPQESKAMLHTVTILNIK